MKLFVAYSKLLFLIAITILGNILPVRAQVKPNAVTAPPTEMPVAVPPAYPSSTPVNYIRTWTPDMPSTDPTVVTSPSRTTSEVKQVTQYFDGLGRSLQAVTKQITSGGRDLVTPTIYDELGREAYQYLPYPQTTGNTNDGKFKQNPFNNQKTAIVGLNLYPGEDIYYGKADYEASPLNRVLKTMSPGNSWTGNDRGVSQSYEVNTTADSVRIWEVDLPVGSLPVNDLSYYVDYTYYPGTLYKNVTVDENGNKTVIFKDMQGRLILKKTALSNEPAGAYTGWLCTYYVYDNTGNLRFVIPPRTVEYLQSHNWTLTQSIADELCFRYEYDGRNRMIIKKVPGAAEVHMVYDNRDRLVFSQDGNQRSAYQWLVTYYDALNRPVETGLYASSANRATLQATMDGTTGNPSAVTYSIPAPGDISVNSRSGNTPIAYTARNSITFLPGFQSGTGDNFTASIDPNAVENSGTTLPADASNPVPPISSSSVTPLTYTYYDGYGWSGHQVFQGGYLSKTTAGGNPYAESPSTYSTKTRGLVTGTRARVVDSSPEKWLTTTTYYDDKARVLQVISANISSGTDVITNKYDFSGKLLSSYAVNHNSQSAVTPETRVLTENKYDAAGRLSTVTKTLNDLSGTKRVIATNTYNELGQLSTKVLGNHLETLTYDYNIRGWLRGINRDYAAGTGSHYFGMELDYDYGFTQNQYNGNIAGERWRSSGDGQRRAYGFSYDDAGRLVGADFTQHTGNDWNTSARVNFSVSNLAYDANGNIMSMKQMGLIGTTSGTVDNLTYGYGNSNNSNQLDHVTDNGGTTAKIGDFKDGHTGNGDYAYDVNGNLTKDLNKGIASITYNYLNLPEQISFTGKGNIRFVYDAAGTKLSKIVTDNTASHTRTTTTDYINGFVYQNDTLQFLPTEDGRVRHLPLHGSTDSSYVYDYFIKDHLGNVRAVLTEQRNFTHYLATMEPKNAQTEDALFYNVDNTREAKPLDYPQDNTTSPNTAVSKLNGRDPNKRIGTSIILKVMAGDTIQAAVRAFYRQQATRKNNAGIPAEQMLTGLLQAFTMPGLQTEAMHSSRLAPNAERSGLGLTADDLRRLKDSVPQNNQEDRPKAYLNYVFFDNQFNFVDDGSGVKQVDGEPNQLETLTSGKVVAKKNGYVYVYTSNESQQDVLFDNFGVMDITGPVLEETHYYPFGLTMSAISAQAFGGIENNYLYQGKELQKDLELGLYDFQARGYDPAIGRTWQIDPHADKYYNLSPYSWTADNPIHNIDPDGKDWYRFKNKIQWYDNSDKRYVDADGNKWRNVGTEFLQFNGKKLTYSWQTTNDDGKRQVHSVSFNAVSGKGDDPTGYWNTTRIFKYSKNRQKQSNVGPIPEGIYSINKRAFVPGKNESGFQNFDDLDLARKLAAPIGFSNWPGGKYSWGPYRWKLQNEGAKTYGRGNFYLHGGGRWGSRGCIDCGSGITDFRDVFMNNQLSNGKIYLQVKYPANFQIEIQNTPTTNFNVIK